MSRDKISGHNISYVYADLIKNNIFETVNVDKFINLKMSIIMKYIFENTI